MFETNMKEAREQKAMLKEFEYETVVTALKYFYNYNLPENISEAELLSLLQFSDMYQMSDLKVFLKFFLKI